MFVNSITLAEVFELTTSRKVPLAPELAGYLLLEIAEGGASVDVILDPTAVHIGEEGTVGVVIAKDAEPGDGEAALRSTLGQLLEASGSQTPALSAIAKRSSNRRPLTELVVELESALIPVNRAAGRRALARLVREARRVRQGVGRNLGPDSGASKVVRPTAPRIAPRAPEGAAAPSSMAMKRAAVAKPESTKSLLTPRSVPPKPEIPETGSVLFGSRKLSEPPKAEVPFEIEREDIDQLLQTFEVSESKADAEVARELKSMAGLEPTPPPPVVNTGDDDDGDDDETLLARSEKLLARTEDTPPEPAPVSSTLASSTRPPATAVSSAPPGRLAPTSDMPTKVDAHPQVFPEDKRLSPPTATNQRAKRARAQTIKLDRLPIKKKRNPLVLAGGVMLGTLAVGLGVTYVAMPNLFTQTQATAVTVTSAAPTSSLFIAASAQCRASVTIRKAPADSEILLRVGQSPADVPRLPVGTRIELVATADGFAPTRGVVLPSSAWERTPQGPHFELKIDLPKAGKVVTWPPGEAGTQVGGRGEPGTVRVTTGKVEGAEIWLLAGLGPDSTYEPVPCDRTAEFLVAGSGTYRNRVKISPIEFSKAPDGQVPGTKRVEIVIR